MNIISHSKLGSDNNIIVTDKKDNFFFVPMPKNASTSTYEFFQQFNWNYYQYSDKSELENKIAIVTLTEPIDRWCSGFSQDYYFQHMTLNLDDDVIIDDIFTNRLNFGLHTKIQSYFLENIDTDKTYFFKKDYCYSRLLELFVVKVMKLKVFNKLHCPKSRMDYDIKNKIFHIVHNNPKYLHLLKRYLEKDLEIYNSVKFYSG